MFLKIYKYILILFCITTLFNNSNAEKITGINNYELNLNNIGDNYKFLLAGHLYGSPSPSIYPAASFLSSINKIIDLNADFFVMLGDFIQHFNPIEIEAFDKSINQKLKIPIFNTPGNHDLPSPELYKLNYGKTFNTFKIKSEAFILLNTELSHCSIEGNQASFLSKNLDEYNSDDSVKNIFIIMHQPLWSKNNGVLDTINPWVNGGPYSENICNSFSRNYIPRIQDISINKSVYLISGDFGCKYYELGKYPLETFPMFYHKDDKYDVTYIGTGICENEYDNIISVVVEQSNITFNAISLNAKTIRNLKEYNLAYWNEKFKNDIPREKVNKKSKGLIKRIFTNKYFYFGLIIGFGAFVFLSITLLIYRKANKYWE